MREDDRGGAEAGCDRLMMLIDVNVDRLMMLIVWCLVPFDV
jgi:hypothetical protein